MTKRAYLYLTVFISGMGVLGVELSASRLLDPFFGNSLIIWANLIGLVLIYLSVGYAIGGRWADQDPRPTTFFQIIAWGGFLVGIIPLVAAPILRLSVQGFADYNSGILIGSLLGVLILFSAPLTLLAMSSPFAIRLAVPDVAQSGRVAGTIYAWSTVGSILGTFLPVLILNPQYRHPAHLHCLCGHPDGCGHRRPIPTFEAAGGTVCGFAGRAGYPDALVQSRFHPRRRGGHL